MEQFRNELESFREILGVKIGKIERNVSAKVERIFETYPLQNLKAREQLGLLYRVNSEWETSVRHTRFDHSVGVVAKCIVAADVANGNTKMAGGTNVLDDRDLLELAAAAAIHDSGHLPISHASERALLATGQKTGVTHEERIIPLLLVDNEYFHEIKSLLLGEWRLPRESLYRIACLLKPDLGAWHARGIKGFTWPKRAASQLLSSELDMDRLDYIIRDATALKYRPVTQLVDRMCLYVKGFSFERTKTIGRPLNDDIELCLDAKYIQEAFQCLVSRVLLYKNMYFSKQVRGFEGGLTHLLGELLDNGIYLDFLRMMTMSDEEFINSYLEDRVAQVKDKELRQKLKKIVDVLRRKKVGTFKYKVSISADAIKNPRLKEEFVEELNSRSYVKSLHETIVSLVKECHDPPAEVDDKVIMLDIFNLKTGGGDFLVKNSNSVLSPVTTLKKYMNGSNMHRLCSEQRIDVYINSDEYPKIEKSIEAGIEKFLQM